MLKRRTANQSKINTATYFLTLNTPEPEIRMEIVALIYFSSFLCICIVSWCTPVEQTRIDRGMWREA